MIKLITKNRYYSLLGEKEPVEEYNIFNGAILNNYNEDGKICHKYFYLEDIGVPFINIISLNKLLIHKKYENSGEIIDIIKKSPLSLTNWKLTYLGEEKRRKYLLNTYLRGNYFKGFIDPTGMYKIENTDFPDETIEFSVITNKYDKYRWDERSYFGFPKKADLDVSIDEINSITKLIILVFKSWKE